MLSHSSAVHDKDLLLLSLSVQEFTEMQAG